MKTLRILLYDSGIGGLNLLYELVLRYPFIEFFYMSDSPNFPYGLKNKSELLNIAVKNLDAVGADNFDAVILACNTLTSSCINELRERYSKVFFLGVTPTAVLDDKTKTLVLCTSRTKKNIIGGLNGNVDIVSADGLVCDIEKNVFNLDKVNLLKYLEGVDFNYRKVVLGCTHFCYLKQAVTKLFENAVIDDGLEPVIQNLKNYITTFDHQRPLLEKVPYNGIYDKFERFIFSDKKRNFEIFKNVLCKK